jgi:hypothetical protein
MDVICMVDSVAASPGMTGYNADVSRCLVYIQIDQRKCIPRDGLPISTLLSVLTTVSMLP